MISAVLSRPAIDSLVNPPGYVCILSLYCLFTNIDSLA